MSRSLNKWAGIGHCGVDPEVRTTPNGTRLAKVSLATSREWADKSGQKQEKTEWHRLTFWGKLAEIVEQYVHKGDRLYVEGRIEYSQTEDDKGNVRYWCDINVQEMVMLGSAGDKRPDTTTPYESDGEGADWGLEHGPKSSHPADLPF